MENFINFKLENVYSESSEIFNQVNDINKYILNENNEVIGEAFGSVSQWGQLTTVIKIYKKDYLNKGLGFQVFKTVFDQLNEVVPIIVINGSWHSGEEFADFEDGRSTNLLVFKNEIENGLDPESAAFSTPTGKWCKKLGFNKCKVIRNWTDETYVHFYKEGFPEEEINNFF